MDTEHAVCDLCGNDSHRVLMHVRDKRHDIPGEFELVECLDCSLQFITPRPTREDIGAYYPPDYAAYRSRKPAGGWRTPFSWAWDRLQRRYLGAYPVFWYRDHHARFAPPGRRPRILDVGCGSGSKLAYLGHHGWETYGLDFSEAAIRQALEDGVDHGTVNHGDELPYDDGFFDAVMSWHSLEHHFSPRASLREMYRVLTPGGHGAVAVPTGDNLGIRLFGNNWGPLEAPRHLYHFTEETLGRLLREVSFEDLEFHYDYTYYGLFLDQEILESLENIAADHGIRLRFPRPAGYTIAARIPLLPFNERLGRLLRGMNLIVHFQKPAP